MRQILGAVLWLCLLPCCSQETKEGPHLDVYEQNEIDKENCTTFGFEGKCENNVLFYCNNGQWETVDCKLIGATCEWDEEYNFNICKPKDGESVLDSLCPNIGESYCKENDGRILIVCLLNEAISVGTWVEQKCDDKNSCTEDFCSEDKCQSKPIACPKQHKCKNGKCICQPSCAYKECGSDGCGGNCGTCVENEECNAIGKCFFPDKDNDGIEVSQDNCPQDYNPNQEDTDNDGLGDVCDVCTPDCTDRECGPDECGGSCGDCAENMVCVDNDYCAPPDCLGSKIPTKNGCTDVMTYEGCCDGNGRLLWCEKGDTYCIDCANLNPVCGWLAEKNFYDCGTNGAVDPSSNFPKDCITECLPDCTNKQCGSDNCGGSCGECPSDYQCANGFCEELPPRPPDQPPSPQPQ